MDNGKLGGNNPICNSQVSLRISSKAARFDYGRISANEGIKTCTTEEEILY